MKMGAIESSASSTPCLISMVPRLSCWRTDSSSGRLWSGLTLQIVHDFSTPGSVTLSCYEDDSSLDLYFSNLKITAIEASSISNVFLGTP